MSQQEDQVVHQQGEDEFVEPQENGEYDEQNNFDGDGEGEGEEYGNEFQNGVEGAAGSGDENGDIDYDQYDPVHHQGHYQQELQEGNADDFAQEGEGSQGNDHSQSIPNMSSNPNDLPQNCIVSPLASRNQVVFHAGGPQAVQVLSHSRVGTVPYTGANGDIEMEAYERTVIEYEPVEKTITVMVPVEKKITDYRPVQKPQPSVIYSSQLRTQSIVPQLMQSGLRVTPFVMPGPITKPVITSSIGLPSSTSNVLYQSQLVTRPFVPPIQQQAFNAPITTSTSTRSLLSTAPPKTIQVGSNLNAKFAQPPATVFIKPSLSNQQFVKPFGQGFSSPTVKSIPATSTVRGPLITPTSFVSRPPASFMQQTLQPRPSFSQSILPIHTIKRQPVLHSVPQKQ